MFYLCEMSAHSGVKYVSLKIIQLATSEYEAPVIHFSETFLIHLYP